jgi:hypothetical protein
MMPTKLKRKCVEDKAKSNGKEKDDKENELASESDYESDQVNYSSNNKHVLLFTCLNLEFFRKTFLPKYRMKKVLTTRMLKMRKNMNQIQQMI